MKRTKVLKAPESYWKLSDTDKKTLLNKCGPNGPLNSVVPNDLLFLDISEACQIHDFTFLESKSLQDHKISDRLFLENQRILIEKNTRNPALKWARHIGAFIYYSATRIYSTMKSILK